MLAPHCNSHGKLWNFFFFMALSIRIKLQICLLQLCGLFFFFSLSPHFADSGFSLVNIWDFHWLTLLPSSKRYQDFFFLPLLIIHQEAAPFDYQCHAFPRLLEGQYAEDESEKGLDKSCSPPRPPQHKTDTFKLKALQEGFSLFNDFKKKI